MERENEPLPKREEFVLYGTGKTEARIEPSVLTEKQFARRFFSVAGVTLLVIMETFMVWQYRDEAMRLRQAVDEQREAIGECQRDAEVKAELIKNLQQPQQQPAEAGKPKEVKPLPAKAKKDKPKPIGQGVLYAHPLYRLEQLKGN